MRTLYWIGTGLLEPGEVGISASNRNFKAASALAGQIAGPGWYERPAHWSGVVCNEGEAYEERSVDETLANVISKLDSIIDTGRQSGFDPDATSASSTEDESSERLTEILPGFPEKVAGEIVLCDADNINTGGIYPGKFVYQDEVPKEKMAEVCMSNYDPSFNAIAKPGDILVSGSNFGCGSSREQATTAILAKGIPLAVAGSFGNIFARNSINNALMGVEVPKLVHRLREAFATSGDKVLTRRTGWTLEWDVRRSLVTVQEGESGDKWSQKVGELPPNVQEIIARGGLENWVKGEIAKDGVAG